MSELIGKTFLGSTFVQDPKQEYIKIDGVTLGESEQFGYKEAKDRNIGRLLDNCLKDDEVVVVIYDWNNKVGYLKKGFDLSNSSDSYANKTGLTTFIVKSRITAANIAYFNQPEQPPTQDTPVPQPTPQPTPDTQDTSEPAQNSIQLPDGSHVRINECLRLAANDKTKFELNGFPFVPVGWNSFFLGLMQETMNYPTKAQVTEIFEAARKMKATVIRSHTLGFSSENSMTLLDYNNNFNNKAWDIIDWAYREAKRCSIKLIIVLCDPYEYYHGSYNTFCKPSGVPKDQFFTHPSPRTEFKKYITGYLNHVNTYTKVAVKDAVEVAFFELGNELGNIRPDANSTVIPTQDWIQDITKHIKSIDKKHLVLNGSDECLGSQQSNDFAVRQLDVFQSHFYWADWDRIKRDASNAKNVNRPYIIGEYDSRWGDDWYRGIEKIPNMRGSMAWSMYPHEDGKPTGKRMPHDDGFTFWYDKQSWDNTNKLLLMTNHFRRMRGLKEVSDLKF